MTNEKWYKLDNAAQLFPMISTRNNTNTFRVAAILKEDIDPNILKDALQATLKRFPTFSVKMRKGLFWYYLEHNDNEPVVRTECPYYCESNVYEIQHEYLFNVSYLGKRLAIEIFHGITDGGGATEFLKTILYHYFILKGYHIENNGEILTEEIEQLLDESQDSFRYNYSKSIKPIEQESKGFQLKGTKHSRTWVGCIQAIIDLPSFKKVTTHYQATVTEYLAALLTQAIYEIYAKDSSSPYPIRLFIPVNARKFFDSRTLRNFVLFIRTKSKFTGEVSFEEILQDVKNTFDEELNKDKLLARIRANVKLETNVLTRFMPLFIKRFVVKIAYRMLGSSVNTMSFSNLGYVKLPEDMRPLIDRMEFGIGGSKENPINVSAISCFDKMVLTFSSFIIERKLQAFVIKRLVEDGVKLVVETNDLEV